MSEKIIMDTNSVPVLGEYDVIVVGGGIAGVAAAVAARRGGCKTLLVEKSIMLGGLATLGLVVYYNPPLCDGKGKKLIGGISEELLHLSIKYGYSSLSEEWEKGKARYSTLFSPSAFVIALDELIQSEDVDMLFDTVYCKSIMEDACCRGIIVENKAGRSCYLAKVVIDATGDADVMSRSGVSCVEEDNWLSYWAIYTNLSRMKEAVDSKSISKAIKIDGLGAKFDGSKAPLGSKKYSLTSAADVTEFIMEGRKLALQRLKTFSKDEECYITLPGTPQYRTTRRIIGLYELSDNDKMSRFDDSIGCVAEESNASFIMEIPYRVLVSKDSKNILAAGRIVSASGYGRHITRLIATSALTGHAAGTAACIAANSGIDVSNIPVTELQQKLKDTGSIIHY